MSMQVIVVAGALRDPAGRWLMQQRPAGKAHAGLWEFPGGKVEPGETPEAALARELGEELGIVVAETALSPIGFASRREADGRLIVLLLYRVASFTGTPRAIEATALRFDSPAALATLPMPPLDVPLIALLERIDAGAG